MTLLTLGQPFPDLDSVIDYIHIIDRDGNLAIEITMPRDVDLEISSILIRLHETVSAFVLRWDVIKENIPIDDVEAALATLDEFTRIHKISVVSDNGVTLTTITP